MKQNLALQFCRKRNKDVSILTETHINLDQIYHIRNNWLDAIFLSPADSHTKGLLVLLHLGLEGITEVKTNPKWRFIYCFYALSGHSTRKQLAKGRSFEGLQNYMEIKKEGNVNKIIPGDFNCTMDKMERDSKNKALYRCHFNYSLSNSSWLLD